MTLLLQIDWHRQKPTGVQIPNDFPLVDLWSIVKRVQGLKIALARLPGLVFLTARLPILCCERPFRLLRKKICKWKSNDTDPSTVSKKKVKYDHEKCKPPWNRWFPWVRPQQLRITHLLTWASEISLLKGPGLVRFVIKFKNLK